MATLSASLIGPLTSGLYQFIPEGGQHPEDNENEDFEVDLTFTITVKGTITKKVKPEPQ